jgi:hypothetical protein
MLVSHVIVSYLSMARNFVKDIRIKS